jgi:hypothetical protein
MKKFLFISLVIGLFAFSAFAQGGGGEFGGKGKKDGGGDTGGKGKVSQMRVSGGGGGSDSGGKG